MTDELVARLRAAGCVFAEEEAAILREAAAGGGDLAHLAARRIAGVPLEHVVGWADFAGVRVPVDPGVFVPRPRSALLVDTLVAELAPGDALLDLCCGSGAIAAAVASGVPVRVVATDVDPVAVTNARRTLAALDAVVETGDLFEAVPPMFRGAFAAIGVVAPYVPSDRIRLLPHEARDFEPLAALDGGVDGLDVLRRAATGCREWLRPGGVFAAEAAEDQADDVARALRAVGLATRTRERDGAVVVMGRAPTGTA